MSLFQLTCAGYPRKDAQDTQTGWCKCTMEGNRGPDEEERVSSLSPFSSQMFLPLYVLLFSYLIGWSCTGVPREGSPSAPVSIEAESYRPPQEAAGSSHCVAWHTILRRFREQVSATTCRPVDANDESVFPGRSALVSGSEKKACASGSTYSSSCLLSLTLPQLWGLHYALQARVYYRVASGSAGRALRTEETAAGMNGTLRKGLVS